MLVTYIDIALEDIRENYSDHPLTGKRNYLMVDIYRDQESAARLASDSRFHFNCHSKLACFNQCCQNPTVILKPYDIIRLRRRLGITTTEFLERYTTKVLEDKSQLPLVMLDIEKEEGMLSFFGGSRLQYLRRPTRSLPPLSYHPGQQPGRDGVIDSYFMKQLNFCQGFTEGQELTLARWKSNQGMEPYDELNRTWLEIILKRGALNPSADDARAPALFTMIAYDIDKFRQFVFQTPFLEIMEIPEDVAAVLQESDVALLRFGYKYLKMVLLIEDTLQMKEEMKILPEPPA